MTNTLSTTATVKRNQIKDAIRALTPWVIAAVVWLVQHFGFHISGLAAGKVAAIVGTAISLLARYLETKWKWFGALLGWIGVPQFSPTVLKTTLEKQLVDALAQNQSLTALVDSLQGTVAAPTVVVTSSAVLDSPAPGTIVSPPPGSVVSDVPATPAPLASASGVTVTAPPA